MTKPIILKAKDFDDMENIAKSFIDKGYKIISSDTKYILAKKRNFGQWYFHLLFLALILFIISNSWILYLVCIMYIAYFIFYLFKKSKIVLITTESTDNNGNPVEFDDINNISDY